MRTTGDNESLQISPKSRSKQRQSKLCVRIVSGSAESGFDLDHVLALVGLFVFLLPADLQRRNISMVEIGALKRRSAQQSHDFVNQ